MKDKFRPMEFNVFKMLFSGWRGYKEEFSSQVLAFLLSPHMPHGLEEKFLKLFLILLKKQIESKGIMKDQKEGIDNILSNIAKIPRESENYCTNIFYADKEDQSNENDLSFKIQLEAHPEKKSYARIDILMKIGRIWFVFENKILPANPNAQIEGYVNDLIIHKQIDKKFIVPICVVPIKNSEKSKAIIIEWEEVAKIIDKLKPQILAISDFSSYIKSQYKNYPNKNLKYEPSPIPYQEFLERASKNNPDIKKAINHILKIWEEINKDCKYTKQPPLLDGPILWINRENEVPVWPFKINNNGTLILQSNALRHIKKQVYEPLQKRMHAVFKGGMNTASVPISWLVANNKMDELPSLFEEAQKLIKKLKD